MTNLEIEIFKAMVDKFLDDAMFKADMEEMADRAMLEDPVYHDECGMCGCVLASDESEVCDTCGYN